MAVLRACRGHGSRLRCALASLLCVFTLAIVSCGSPASQAPTPTPGKVLRGALTVDGVERSYRLFRPSLAAGMKVPLVIVLHEYGTTGEDMSALSLYDQQATKSQFITVYPDGIGGSWNAGACCTPATTRGIDDVKFVGLLIERVASQEPIDASRVFVVGFSNGAAMTYRLACELAERIRAVTSVSGGMLLENCRPARPVSIQEIHGTKDTIFPIQGGAVGNVNTLSLASEIQQWVTLDGCTGNPIPGGSGVHKTSTWNTCRNKAVVKLDTIEGEGHSWFADATSSSWQFFSAIVSG